MWARAGARPTFLTSAPTLAHIPRSTALLRTVVRPPHTKTSTSHPSRSSRPWARAALGRYDSPCARPKCRSKSALSRLPCQQLASVTTAKNCDHDRPTRESNRRGGHVPPLRHPRTPACARSGLQCASCRGAGSPAAAAAAAAAAGLPADGPPQCVRHTRPGPRHRDDWAPGPNRPSSAAGPSRAAPTSAAGKRRLGRGRAGARGMPGGGAVAVPAQAIPARNPGPGPGTLSGSRIPGNSDSEARPP